MAIAAALVVVPLGLLFLLSGLIVNLVQAIFFITIRPFSKSLYRRINRVVAELLWLQVIWLVDWWAGVKKSLQTFSSRKMRSPREHQLAYEIEPYNMHKLPYEFLCLTLQVKSMHLSFQTIKVTLIGLLDGFCLSNGIMCLKRKHTKRSGCLGSTLAVMKKSSKFLPVIGWSMWFTEYLFLERSWAKDESTLKSGLQQLKDFPRPFWLALFVEGTRFTPAKLLAAQEYAASQGLPIPRNVLIPRTKGFVSAVSIMRSFVPAIYDVTVAIPSDQPPPTMFRILKGQSSVNSGWVAVENRPEKGKGIYTWVAPEDVLLDKHKSEGTFGVEPRQLGQPIKSLLVVVFWSGLLSYATFRFFEWTELLSTWKGVVLTTAAVILVTIVMHIFIRFSESERSSTARAARNRAKKD
ncbi:hypothetical protein C4D60_Mb11t10800 [Musa balbisiana]|uniref:Phospholipid/glycerol acyltransferase domain-containing protein n=1 Tax=Musa balbisiana TaxID=52838 RepID=A0A4S8J5N8_MUSBA|nr:hypothetical protein C4D60_Mb11t10800 [Musa balbisiana]